MAEIHLRPARPNDGAAIREIYLAAFSSAENRLVAELAVRLLEEPAAVGLVAEVEGRVAGHVAFSRVWSADEVGWSGSILAPLAVQPGWQRRGVGARLVERGIEVMAGQGCEVVLVYGDPAYYGRFGFAGVEAGRFVPPYGLTQPLGWQVRRLRAGGVAERVGRIECVEALRDPVLW